MDSARLCHGGPMDGQTVVSRFPAGFVAIDRPLGLAWLYDRQGEEFRVREPEGRPLDPDKRLYAAFEDEEWDVLAVPDIGRTADVVDADEEGTP